MVRKWIIRTREELLIISISMRQLVLALNSRFRRLYTPAVPWPVYRFLPLRGLSLECVWILQLSSFSSWKHPLDLLNNSYQCCIKASALFPWHFTLPSQLLAVNACSTYAEGGNGRHRQMGRRVAGEQLCRKGFGGCWWQHAPAAKGLGCIKSTGSQWFSCYIYGWCSLTLNIWCGSGLHDRKRTLKSLKASRGGQQSLYKGRKAGPVRRGWGHPEQEAEGRPHCSVQPPEEETCRGRCRSLLPVTDDRMQGNGTELHQGSFTLDVRKNFFVVRVTKHRNRFFTEVADAPCLSVLKWHWGNTLNIFFK